MANVESGNCTICGKPRDWAIDNHPQMVCFACAHPNRNTTFFGVSGLWDICAMCRLGNHGNHRSDEPSRCSTIIALSNTSSRFSCACRTVYLKHRPLDCVVVGVGPHGLVYDDHGRLSYANGQTVPKDHVNTKLQLAEPGCLGGFLTLVEQQFAADDLKRGRAQYLLSVIKGIT